MDCIVSSFAILLLLFFPLVIFSRLLLGRDGFSTMIGVLGRDVVLGVLRGAVFLVSLPFIILGGAVGGISTRPRRRRARRRRRMR